MTEAQKAYQRETNALLKACHMCKDCRKQYAFTLNGRTYCYECNEKRNAWQRQRYAEKLAENKDYWKNRYAHRRSVGKCGKCGRDMQPGDTGSRCPICKGKNKKTYTEKYVRRRVGNVCYQCCNAPPMEGKKLCPECYARNLVICRAMNDKNRRMKHGDVKSG